MNFSFFRSMTGRVFLFLLVGVLASAALSLWLAFGERQRTIGQFRDLHALERAEQLVLALDAIPAEHRSGFLTISKRSGLRVEPAQPNQDAKTNRSEFANALSERLGPDFRIVSLPPATDCKMLRPAATFSAPSMRAVCESLIVTMHDGSRLRMTVLPPRSPTPLPRTDFIEYLALFLISIAVLAYAVARMTMHPLKHLAKAAEDLGNDINHPPLAEQGATEIRQAAAAFNAMQSRIRQHIQQRTHMLAAISHDLQTPLTRLRLRLEKVSDPELRGKLVDDLSAMHLMVREGLDLARSLDSAEALQPLDLDSLLDSVCSDAADAGQSVTLHGRTGLSVNARPVALQRCLINLIDNAVKYGQFAHMAVQRETINGRAGAAIRIRDGGPGIAPEQLQKVFEPFYRIETSRSRDTGGTGLGLTIARNLAEQHGGTLTLHNHPGGLEASLWLPALIK